LLSSDSMRRDSCLFWSTICAIRNITASRPQNSSVYLPDPSPPLSRCIGAIVSTNSSKAVDLNRHFIFDPL
jgi:hypothetical protein